MNKIYNIGNIAYYNDSYFEKVRYSDRNIKST